MSPYVPADLAVLLLHQEAVRTGDARLRIRQATLRQWVRRDHITYNRRLGGFDVASIIKYVTGRSASGQWARHVDRGQSGVSQSRAVPPVCPQRESA